MIMKMNMTSVQDWTSFTLPKKYCVKMLFVSPTFEGFAVWQYQVKDNPPARLLPVQEDICLVGVTLLVVGEVNTALLICYNV